MTGTTPDASPHPVLAVRGLTVAYGAVVAVRDIDLEVERGTTVAILGANGAGKTSLLRAISGLEPVQAGRIEIDGEDLTGARPHRIARRGVAHVPDNRGIFPTLTVAENLRMGLYGAGRDRDADADTALTEVLDLFPILEQRSEQTAGNLSGGQQQMLTIARALLQDPELLMLDEMSMGLAPSIVEELFDVVRRLRARGIAVLLVEQFVGGALGVADRVLVLEQGRVVTAGTPAELAQDDLATAYLGGEEHVEIGPVPPAPGRVTEQVGTTLGPREARALERIAARRGTSIEDVLRDATARLLSEHAPDHAPDRAADPDPHRGGAR